MNSEEYYAESIIKLCDEYFKMSAYDLYKSKISPVALVAGVSEILRNYVKVKQSDGESWIEEFKKNV